MVLCGSRVWSTEWKEYRAQDYGISAKELTFFCNRNGRKVEIMPEAIAFIAGLLSLIPGVR
jgi:hypothetical protein